MAKDDNDWMEHELCNLQYQITELCNERDDLTDALYTANEEGATARTDYSILKQTFDDKLATENGALSRKLCLYTDLIDEYEKIVVQYA
ncbi:unnamed protein product, partial [marine sediment metagenome]